MCFGHCLSLCVDRKGKLAHVPGIPAFVRLPRSRPRMAPRLRDGGESAGEVRVAAGRSGHETHPADLRYLIRFRRCKRRATGAVVRSSSNTGRCSNDEEEMKRQVEAHERSEDISDDVMNEVVKALRKRVRKVDHSYDIPYIAGYSKDARTIYIDRHLPRSFRSWTSRVYVTPFLLTHEIVEKALLFACAPDRAADEARHGGSSRHFLAHLRRLHEKAREAYRGGKIATGPARSRPDAIPRFEGFSASARSRDEGAPTGSQASPSPRRHDRGPSPPLTLPAVGRQFERAAWERTVAW
jgi:hypothetical protein